VGIPGTFGARETDLIVNSTLGWNELSHSKTFSNVITKDISFEFHSFIEEETGGIDSQSSQFAGGLQFLLNLPGTVAFSVWADKEINHSSPASCGPAFPFAGALGASPCAVFPAASFSGDRYFHTVPKLNLNITEPLTFLPPSLPLTWGNTTTVTFPKGTGIGTSNMYAVCGAPSAAGFGGCLANTETKAEVWEDNRLTLDDGQVFWGKPGIWETYVGYRYWYNKFGTDHNAPLFATIAPKTNIESTAYLGTTYHFK
jgi:hypothetical protein